MKNAKEAIEWKSPAERRRVGRALRVQRLRDGATQNQIAKVIGCTPALVGHVEAGIGGARATALKIAWALGYRLDELV